MLQDGTVVVTAGTNCGGANLAQAHAVTPSGAVEDELCGGPAFRSEKALLGIAFFI